MRVASILGVGRAAVAGLSMCVLAGCLGSQAKDDTFSLSASPEVTGRGAKSRQILVPEPTALKALDSEQIVIRVTKSEIQYLAGARWGDRLPKMVQSKLVESFENSGRFGGVGKPGEGLAIDFQVVSDIRAFQIEATGGERAYVEISVKLLNDRNGTVRAQKTFTATAPVAGSGNKAFVAALDSAFAKATSEIVSWTLTSV
jgi:cholesterol transport system auxiliary component